MSAVADQSVTAAPDLQDIKAKTIRGGAVALSVQGVKFALRTGSMIILARLLTPNDFGLVAMVTGVTSFFAIFRDVGLSVATVQRPSITHEQISTLFWVNLSVGAMLTAMCLALGPILVRFYHEPRLLWITIGIAGMFFFTAAGVQHQALLQRSMRFGTLGIIDLISLTVSVLIAIGMALANCGYWALVGMTVSLPLVNAIALWIANPWLPGLPRRGCGVRSMLHFGGTYTFNMLMVYIAYNADKILLGRFYGAEPLGLYSRAQTLINLPTDQLNSAIGNVALPTLSKLQGDPPRLKSYFLQGYGLVLSVTIPITVFCILFAEELIYVLMGAKWAAAVPAFRLLSPTVLALALINPFGWLMFAKGQAVRSLYMSFVLAPLVILAYWVGLRYGPNGVAIGYSAMMALLTVPFILWSKAGSPITGKDTLNAIKKPALAGILAGFAGAAIKIAMAEQVPAYIRLITGVIVTIGLYAWLLLYPMGQKNFYLGLLGLLSPRFRASGRMPS